MVNLKPTTIAHTKLQFFVSAPASFPRCPKVIRSSWSLDRYLNRGGRGAGQAAAAHAAAAADGDDQGRNSKYESVGAKAAVVDEALERQFF